MQTAESDRASHARWSLDERFPNDLFDKRDSDIPSAITVNGLRYAIPALTKRLAYLPEQYVGSTVLLAVASMWRLRRGEQPLEESEAFWRQEIQENRLWLRRKVKDKDDPAGLWALVNIADIASKGDCIMVVLHRHERVVPAVQLQKLLETEDFVVVDKPAGLACSWDVEEANSLRAVVCEQLGMDGLRLAHRLDICVTGCLILARTKKLAEKFLQENQKGMVRKIYIARVQGELPATLQVGVKSFAWVLGEESLQADARICGGNRPSLCLDAPLSYDGHAARSVVDNTCGSPCSTYITWLYTLLDGTHVVLCQPKTGLTHQIRCHLASVGLPIANDTLYGGLHETLKQGNGAIPLFQDDETGVLQKSFGNGGKFFFDWCPKCREVAAVICKESPAPQLGSSEIWLRAWRYSLPSVGLDVASSLPDWAFDNFGGCTDDPE